ncbi:UNKNOWN [Stylonychia lemnae]|uniref:Uncharacterized protein n=1 Tax=Stylonychia lemnae TaxID=5949 RepID=A0A078A3I2_STYLE|nr:UNKNOWN [Stylonychia lemnae]|eukprot:CDW76737.1 UNKNOWN [Stylonychia lemnae]
MRKSLVNKAGKYLSQIDEIPRMKNFIEEFKFDYQDEGVEKSSNSRRKPSRLDSENTTNTHTSDIPCRQPYYSDMKEEQENQKLQKWEQMESRILQYLQDNNISVVDVMEEKKNELKQTFKSISPTPGTRNRGSILLERRKTSLTIQPLSREYD